MTKVQRKFQIPTISPENFSPGKIPDPDKLRHILFSSSNLKGQDLTYYPKNRVSPLDKLAQLGKAQQIQGFSEINNLTKDKNVKVNTNQKTDKQYFTEKQKAKIISYALAKRLSSLNSVLSQSYINTMYCNSQITKDEIKTTSQYCKNRICPICNRIRTAKLINAYIPEFQKWENISFVTLTIPNVKANDLKDSIRRMEAAFIKIKDVLKKRNENLKGVRKLEVTYNPDEKTYHPHFHLITENLRGDILAMWKHYLPETNYKAQDIKKANEGSAKELFKYFSKVIFKGSFHPVQMDIILLAVRNKRVFQSYGFKLSKEMSEAQEIEQLQAQQLTQSFYKSKSDGLYSWMDEIKSWINENGEILHEYKPDKKTETLLSKIKGNKTAPEPYDNEKKEINEAGKSTPFFSSQLFKVG